MWGESGWLVSFSRSGAGYTELLEGETLEFVNEQNCFMHLTVGLYVFLATNREDKTKQGTRGFYILN
jgi:hypothetical protein